jgi:hypothetical protein
MSTNLFEFATAVFVAGALLTTGATLLYAVLERIGKIAKPPLPEIIVIDTSDGHTRRIILNDNATLFDPVTPGEEEQDAKKHGQGIERSRITL